MSITPFSKLSHPRELCRQFTPNWFAVNMGIGVVALILPHLSSAVWVLILAQTLFFINSILLIIFFILLIGRIIFFFSTLKPLFTHNIQPMAFGCLPMGLATIINGSLLFYGTVHLAEILWWIDCALSILSALVIPYLMFTQQTHHMETMSATWLLPIVPSEVAATSGALLITNLPAEKASIILIMCYCLWAISVFIAAGIVINFMQRLILHKLPTPETAASLWLILGPIGTGSFGIMLLGHDTTSLLSIATIPALQSMLQIANGFGLILGLMLWAYGLWWLSIAIISVLVLFWHRKMKFNLGWWAFTFPLGVYCLATFELANQTHLFGFTIIAVFLTILLLSNFLIVITKTIIGAYQGVLFSDISLK